MYVGVPGLAPEAAYGGFQQQMMPAQRASPPRVRNPRIADVEKRFIHGVIIGRTKDEHRHYLLYSASVGLTLVSNEVRDLFIGQWLGIHTAILDFQGTVILDHSNSEGFEERDDLPDPAFAFVKFYPSRADPNEGEVIVTCRFRIGVNPQSGCLGLQSYDIEFSDLIDDYKLVQLSGGWYDGRNFIVEAQASLDGWVAMKVHEDYAGNFSCDALPDPLVDFNIQFLEDCDPALLEIMVGDGHLHVPDNAPSPDDYYEEHAGSLGQNQPSTSTSSQAVPSEVSEIELRQIESSMSKTTITNEPRTETPQASTSRQETTPAPKEQANVVTEVVSDDEIDDEDTEGTLGTNGIVPKEFIKEVAGETYRRLTTDRAWTDRAPESALCVVVQKIDRVAIMWSAKRDVQNVLLFEQECEGVTESIKLGQVAFFEISPRRMETQDEMLPRAPYSHIAVRLKPHDEGFQPKIDRFQSKIRCFGNLVEMKVTIPLTQKRSIEIFHLEGDQYVHEQDKSYYFLHATNGVRVSIPSDRLVSYLKTDFTADFDLIAWASHRKAVGTVTLHIGRSGEAFQRYKDGRILELPPLSSSHYMMNVIKK